MLLEDQASLLLDGLEVPSNNLVCCTGVPNNDPQYHVLLEVPSAQKSFFDVFYLVLQLLSQ